MRKESNVGLTVFCCVVKPNRVNYSYILLVENDHLVLYHGESYHKPNMTQLVVTAFGFRAIRWDGYVSKLKVL